MIKRDLKPSCRVPGREGPKVAVVKDLRTWLLENSGPSRRTIKKTHASARTAPFLTGLARGWEDLGSGPEDLDETAPSAAEAAREGGLRRGGGGAPARRGKTQGKTSQGEAEAEPPDSGSSSAELPSGGRAEGASGRRGASEGRPKLFGWRPRSKGTKRLELVLESLGGDSAQEPAEEGEERSAAPPAPGAAHEPPEAAPAAPEDQAVAAPPSGPAEKAPQSFVFGPELFWRQLRRLRPRAREPYTDFAAQVTGLVGAWVEKAGAGTREEVIELVRLEHVLDQLPEQLAQLVLTQKPKTAMEAAALADRLSFARGRHVGQGPGVGPGIRPWFSQAQVGLCPTPFPPGKGTKKSTPKGYTLGREVTPKKEFQLLGGGKPTLVRACHKCGKMGHTRINCPSWNCAES